MAKRRGQREPVAESDEPVAVVFGVLREPGAGYRSVRVELPRSVLERYGVEVSEPDLRAITVGRVVAQLERHASEVV